MRWALVAVGVVGCRGQAPAERTTATAAPAPHGEARPCSREHENRVGEWRYALIAPLYSPVEDISSAELAAMWRGAGPRTLAMTAETRDALAPTSRIDVIASTTKPVLTAKRWAIVPADELVPNWNVVTVDGHHPLEAAADGPLTVPLCADAVSSVRNIDPEAITTVAMTGVTAMARYTAALMDAKGITYPARDVADWFAATDFVHASNEVAFVTTCDPQERPEAFCSREQYIDLLAALHVNIVELSGSHLLDYGTRWLTHSIEMYEARGWKFFGGGRDQLEATRPLLIEHHGNKLAFIGCNVPRSTSNTIRNGPNVGFCDLKRLDWQMRDLRERGYLPIVSMQHEEVATHEPPSLLVRDFRRLADAGAAIVFGSQAHVAHPWEVHAGAYLHYGAGNFIFDQPWVSTRDAAADRFYFHRGRLLSARRLYTRLEEQGRPRRMTDRERAGFLATLAEALATVEPARPWAAPRTARRDRHTPDSFLLGKEAVLLRIATPATSTNKAPLVIDFTSRKPVADDAFTVSLRKWPAVGRKHLAKAITEFMSAKYPIDSDRVTIR